MKIIFLDADGTLFHPMGYIPDSAKFAIQKAKENGHLICLCTGRQKAEVYGDLADIDYNGIVVGSGAYVEAKGKELCNVCFEYDQIQRLCDYFIKHNIPVIYESSFCVYGQQIVVDALQSLIDIQCAHLSKEARDSHGLTRLLNSVHLETEENIRNAPINKISFLESHVSYQEIYDYLHDEFDVIQATFAPLGKESGEIGHYGISKGNGMQHLIQHYQIQPEDVIAIGDGYNDIKMFEKAHVSVAMGNAPKDIQDMCDLVTTSIDEDGIYHAFQLLNII